MRARAAIVLLVLAACPTALLAGEGRGGSVIASSLNVRKGPGTENAVLFALQAGDRIRVVGQRGDWLAVVAESADGPRKGWVHSRYVQLDPKPLESLPRKRGEKLRFVLDHDRSTLDLLGAEGTRLRQRAWHRNDYPGSPAGPNEGEARKLAGALKGLLPERRVNTGPLKLPFDWSAVEPNLVAVPGQDRYRLHRLAAESYVKMRQAAADDGVTLRLVSAARTPAHQRRLAGQNSNPSAVARGTSAHNYGLAIDLAMNPGASRKLEEVTTKPFSNVMAMRSTPVHKWMFFFAAGHGWHPYTNEPWHWEFNPEGLKKRFP